MGFFNILSKVLGDKAKKDKKIIMPYIEKIEMVYPTIQSLSNDDLRQKTLYIRTEIQQYVAEETAKINALKAQIEGQEIEEREKTYAEIDKLEKAKVDKLEIILDEKLPEVFAIVKDTARRLSEGEVEVTASDFDRQLAAEGKDFLTIDGDKAIYHNHWMAGGSEIIWNMSHYQCQLFGGVVLHKGKIAEMATGEGKTLVATLPVFLNALTGNGVHVITVNDYLSKRDSEWMGPLYQFHGLSVDCIDKHQPNSNARRKAYMADITFGTNNEFGFDYLRDNMASSVGELVQRSHNYAIVDEVDSVLIDDARTPLIIAGPVPRAHDQQYESLCPRVEALVAKQRKLATDYLAEAKRLLASPDKESQKEGGLALFRSYKALPKNTPLIKYLSEEGIKTILLKTEEYYMQDNNRNMPEATNPLYFVIEEKNNSIELTDKGINELTGASDDPKFFVMPDIGSEIAALEKMGLSKEEKVAKKDELLQNYSVKSERIHTVNQLLKAYTLFQKDDQYVIIDGQVKIVDEQTGRIMDGRRYSDGLHQAIEAKERVEVQAATQTFATITLQNYFRMYHKLAGMTGTAETEAGEFWDIYKLDVVVIPTNRPIARKDMDDRVYRTKREKYNAVIEEIERLTSAGRPVLVGTTSVEISELLSKMLTMRHISHDVLNAKQHQREAEIVANAGLSGKVTIATNMAGRGTDIKLSDEVKAAGGLAIIGTERHESRRVDRQLRGRSGRQGDPGSSVFFVSLEDKLMRLFGSEKIAGLMDRMGFKEGEVIEHSMVSKAIERAQRRVEENHFGVRKRLLEYDDVMNAQREGIYKERRQTLNGERMGVNIMNMIFNTIARFTESARDRHSFELYKEDLIRTLALDTELSEDDFYNLREEVVAQKVFDEAMAAFKRKTAAIATTTFPVIKSVFEQQGGQYQNIAIPITDGRVTYNIPVNLQAAYESEGKEVVKVFERAVLLHTIDEHWKEHLRDMDELRDSVQNASYEQKDPLLIYKIEAFKLYDNMLRRMNAAAVSVLMRMQIPAPTPEEQARMQEMAAQMQQQQSQQAVESQEAPAIPTQEEIAERRRLMAARHRAEMEAAAEQQQLRDPNYAGKKIGRNDPCPCGSGKKYKNCHGKNAE
ncbi:MAG: preprotein translocase subunit SecA [Paludibacteraceae bacterium]|nr:preprotein translocase subunit SecA [Paludibacteraceae bacterium]